MTLRTTQGNKPGSAREAKTPGSKVEVKKEEATTVAADNEARVTLTLTNDSENTIYVWKGAGAKVGEGIPLKKEGGAVIIDDYSGVVTAAAKTAASSLCVVEV